MTELSFWFVSSHVETNIPDRVSYRVVLPHGRSSLIKRPPRTNAKSYTKSHCGACTHCKTICCKLATRLWRKIGLLLLHVCLPCALLVRFLTWSLGIKRTKLRLLRCRARMEMNDRDRVKDARADQNLVDVARIPAPWDKPSEPTVTQ